MAANRTEPELGMPATLQIATDCLPCTVVQINKKKTVIWIQEDHARVVEGGEHDGSAKYEYTRNPDGRKWRVSLRKTGQWKVSGVPLRSWGMAVGLGHRRRYYDPHF